MKRLHNFKEIFKDDSLPSLKDACGHNELPDKKRILAYLRRGRETAVAAGSAVDVFTGEKIPGEFVCQTDGEYHWRSDVTYYVDKYNLQLPLEFIEKVVSK